MVIYWELEHSLYSVRAPAACYVADQGLRKNQHALNGETKRLGCIHPADRLSRLHRRSYYWLSSEVNVIGRD